MTIGERASDATLCDPESTQTVDPPHLGLDELVDELARRANDSRSVRERLQILLRAIRTITTDPSVDVVLRTVLETAGELAAATYGAVGLIGAEGELEQFFEIGQDRPAVHRTGHQAEPEELLAPVAAAAGSVRGPGTNASEAADMPSSRPRMDSFVGVPLRARDNVVGALYLAGPARGEFSDEDEAVMLALAGAAGSAIGNARLHRELHRQHLWLQAAVEVGARVLSPTGEDALRLVARRALDVADADVVSVSILDPDGDALIVEAAVGRNAESLVGRQFPVADGPFGETVRTGIPRRVGAEELPAGRWGEPAFGGGSTMLLPLAGMAGPRGVLAVARREGRPDFTGRELELAASFAAHAGVAVQLVDSRLAEQRLALLEDRDRIAMDLHDHVIQELFAIGMNFEAAALRSTDADLAARIRRGVESIDATIRRIRSSIFQLRVPSRGELRDRILQLNGELSEVLGFVPGLTVSGPLGNLQDAALVEDVVASLRESLTNVARHAHATAVTVDLVVGDGQLTMTVTDNGLGLPVSTNRRSGLANLRARAEHHAGSFEIGAAPGGGTAVRWTVRLP